MTADASIDYESLQQEAMRGLVRAVLVRVAKSGLPGEHHLYISFDVRAAGVVLSKRLREKYPHEMTIVLQHRFWDLSVTDERFEVKLTFDGIPERLVVPFTAIKVFLDPSVRYVVHFEEPHAAADGESDADNQRLPADTDDDTRSQGTRTGPSKKPRTVRPRPRADKDGAGLSAVPNTAPAALTKPASVQSLPNKAKPQSIAPASPPAAAPAGFPAQAAPAASGAAPPPASGPPSADKPAASNGAQVVSLDAFRKK